MGWLKKQLEIQADGLNGNLDKVWPSVKDSAWIGGTDEGWERVPYWLDGFIPLAYLLDDKDLIGRAKKYINAIIAKQNKDGWICPCKAEDIPTYDTWAVLLISKVLVVYYECSSDERIPDVLYNVLKNYYDLLKSGSIKLFAWGEFRWFEGFIGIDFLKKHFKDEWISDLAHILKSQGKDFCEDFEMWEKPLNKWTYNTHVVNLAMMLRSEALSCDALGEDYKDYAKQYLDILFKYNGTPVGTFTGDECLSGLSPIQGTELCAVVELMYSYECLFSYTGDSKWLSLLELVAFNALPAAISDDMWSHQYDQMSNQISCIKFTGNPIFGTNNGEAHLFGLEPNFGCCTSNFGQGWPKFALSAFMHNNDTVVCAVPVPTELHSNGINILLESNYPFENKLVFNVSTEKEFVLEVPIKLFAENIRINGVKTQEYNLKFKFAKNEKRAITIEFDTKPEVLKRPHNLNIVKCGSLVFSLPLKYEKRIIEYTKDGVERKFPYCDYEYYSNDNWEFGFSGKEFTKIFNGIGKIPFDSKNPPIIIKTKMAGINWGYQKRYENVCSKIPNNIKATDKLVEKELHPYGCAKLRVTEIPFVKE